MGWMRYGDGRGRRTVQVRRSANGTIKSRSAQCPARCSWSPRRSATSKTSQPGRCGSSARRRSIAAEDTRRTRQLLERYAIAHADHEPARAQRSREERRARRAAGARRTRRARDRRGDARRLRSRPHAHPRRDRRGVSGRDDSRAERRDGRAGRLGPRLPRRFTFLGFPPTRSSDRKRVVRQTVRTAGRTVVFFEAPASNHGDAAPTSQPRSAIARSPWDAS